MRARVREVREEQDGAALGSILASISRRLASSSVPMMLTPVVLPSGRRMLVTNLALTKSSDMAAMRMLVVAEHSQRKEDGVEVQGVACLSASNAGRRRADREHLPCRHQYTPGAPCAREIMRSLFGHWAASLTKL